MVERAECPACHRVKRLRSKRGTCSACYMRGNRKTSTEAYERHKAKVTEYAKRNKTKRLEWVHAYRDRICARISADVKELRRAVKRLEQAVAAATERERVRGAGEPSSDACAQR